ncbi:MAG: PDZ domain-containing protein [Ginsengibacter sp.]
MKKIFIPAFLIAYLGCCSTIVLGQDNNAVEKKTREIIIRSNGDKETKMSIEINGDKVTVDGKPLSEFKNGDVSIIEREQLKVRKGSGNFNWNGGSEDEDMDIRVFEDAPAIGGSRTFLGVITEKGDNGVSVKEAVKGSGAEKAGLKEGDVITKIDDKSIQSPEALIEVIRSHKAGDEIKLYYNRDGKKNDVKVKLGETKERERVRIFRNDNGPNKNFDYNFQMPRVPGSGNMPNTFFKYFRNDNVKLGVKVEDTKDETGAKVLEVTTGSAADKAGLKKDDIITELAGEKVNDINDLRSELLHHVDEENFTIKGKRNKTIMSFDVKIPKPANSADL